MVTLNILVLYSQLLPALSSEREIQRKVLESPKVDNHLKNCISFKADLLKIW
ncbi:hypothetical protein AAHE18_02G045700 [Arachis hypogaea]